MSDDHIQHRFTYAAQIVLGRDVMAMRQDEWHKLICTDGTPTLLNQAPTPVEKVMTDAMVVAVAASGICNPDPGFDIVRLDLKDAPYIYNIDHYQVHENLSSHQHYSDICKTAGVTQSLKLDKCVSQYVFVVMKKPSETNDHWSKELPDRINIARHKSSK